jgi:hypothetical protein
METKHILRYALTRRTTGRRSLTPMRSKQKKTIPKTRGHRVGKKPHVPIFKHTSPQRDGERKTEDKKEHSEHQERQGNQDSGDQGTWKDTKEYTQIESGRNTENSEKPVHPGPLQTVLELSKQTALHETSDNAEIESEELSPLQ